MEEDLAKLAEHLNLNKRQVDREIMRSITQVLRAASTLIAREVAKNTFVKVQIIKNRIKIFDREKSLAKKLSMLTFAVPAIIAGNYTVTKTGVRVNRKNIRGAFITTVDGKKHIFKRKGHARYPIEKIRVSVAEKAEHAFIGIESEIEEKFVKALERNLKIAGGLIKIGK